MSVGPDTMGRMVPQPRVQEVVFSALDPAALAAFWGNLLERPWGYDAEAGGVVAGDGLCLYFQQWREPKASRNRLHLDVEVDDLHAWVARATSLGATLMSRYHEDPGFGGFVSLRDPEGNEFDLVTQVNGSWQGLLEGLAARSAGVDPFVAPPVVETPGFRLRRVRADDAEDLLACYADPAAWALFNTDRCAGDFHMTTPDQIRACIQAWLVDGPVTRYVRLAVIDRAGGAAVGTVEWFAPPPPDDGTEPWLLWRCDLAPAYEDTAHLAELFGLTPMLFDLFGVRRVLTRTPAPTGPRADVLTGLGYAPFDWHRPGNTGTYWAAEKG